MKKTIKKGFTLVELLVVIAILAILATVSVVGYTAFIERATVSNDENVAAQLNQFLTAMKADSTGKYYDEPITPDNVWEVVNAALEDNGTLTDLEPQSLDYGYHYFYKFNKNTEGDYENGEIVVAKKDDIITQARKGFFFAHAGNLEDATNEHGVGFFFVGEGENKTLYFFLDTKGSDLSTVVNALNNSAGINSWNRIEGANSEEKIQKVIEAVKSVNKDIYTEKLNGNRLVGKTGQYATNENADKNVIFIEEGASAGDTVTIIGTTSTVPAQPLNPGSETTITVPAGAQVSKGALDVAEGNTKVTIVIETGSLADIATSEGNPGTIEAGFTNTTNVTIKVDNDNGSYTVDAAVTEIVKVEGETSKSTEHRFGTGLFPMTSFDIVANKNGVYTDIRTGDAKLVYVSNDIGKVSFDITNIEGQTGKPVSKGKVTWTVVSVKLNGDTTTDITENLDTYAKFVNNELTFKQDKEIYSIKVKATSDANAEVYSEYNVNVVSIANVSGLKLGGTELVSGNTGITLGNAFADENDNNTKKNTTFTLSVENKAVTYNHTESGYSVTVNNNVSLDTSNEKFDINDETKTVTLKANEDFAVTDAEIKVKVGSYFEKTYKVTLYDQCRLAWNKTSSNIRYLGNEGAKLNSSVILARNTDVAYPEGAQLYVFSGTGDAPTYPCKSKDFTPINSKYYTIIEKDKDSKGNVISYELIFTNEVTSKYPYKVAWAVETKKTVNGQDEYEYEIVSDMWDIRAVSGYNLVSTDFPANENSDWTHTIFHKDPGANHKTDGKLGLGHNKSDCEDNATHHVATDKNVVLLSNYTVPDQGYLTLGESKTLYGNCFTIDLSKARNNSTGMIELSKGSSLLDTAIIGQTYTKEEDPWYNGSQYPTNAIKWKGFVACETGTAASVQVRGDDATITNCYISGGRAPVRLTGKKATINNTILFGGAYATLDSQPVGEFTLNNVITVNQYDATHNPYIGPGIIVSGDDNDNTKIVIKGTFIQYNFVSESDKSHFANSVIGTATGALDDYSELKFTYSSKDYYNMGIMFLNHNNSKQNDKNSGEYTTNCKVNIECEGTYLPANYKSLGYGLLSTGTGSATIATLSNSAKIDMKECLAKTVYYSPKSINTNGNFNMGYDNWT